MIEFLLVAAVMAMIAAAAVAVPLLRERRSRLLAGIAAVLVVGAAAGLYSLWSTWNWNVPPQIAASPASGAMVAKLEQQLRHQPNDLQGWLLLGRSYAALNRWDDAIVAYERAHALSGGKDLQATIGYGEALAIRAGGEITPHAAQLFEAAVALAPNNPKALLYGGFAAAVRGDRTLARSRWEALLAEHPPAPVVQMLNERIADLGPAPSPVTGATSASVIVTIRVAPALRSRLRGNAPLFVFARAPGGPGPPLAAKRVTTAAIGTQIKLSNADSMIPGRVLTDGEHVLVTARVFFSGQPSPAAGDLYGEVSYDVGRDGARDLVIDRVAR